MPPRLTRSQRQVLLRAGLDDKATAKHVHAAVGEALQRKGYGYYHPFPDRKFYLNGAGLKFSTHNETLE